MVTGLAKKQKKRKEKERKRHFKNDCFCLTLICMYFFLDFKAIGKMMKGKEFTYKHDQLKKHYRLLIIKE